MSVSPLNSALVAIAAICLANALVHLVIGARSRDRRNHLWFGLAAMAAAASTAVEPLVYRAGSEAGFASGAEILDSDLIHTASHKIQEHIASQGDLRAKGVAKGLITV